MEMQERLRAELETLVPRPGMSGSDWSDVLSRSGRRRSTLRRRASTVAIVALSLGLLAASPLAGAIAGGVADFSAWLTGQPGTPASSQEQREFERANSRSWAQFPNSPALRRLITTQVAGASFELLGFRTGDSLCLRLVARGLPGAEGNGANAPATSCAPLRELRSARAPALVVLTDHPFGAGELPADAPLDSYAQARAQATAGIVADGVRRLLLEDQRGEHQALVASNAFLFVAERPPVGTRTRRAFALGEDGQRIDVPLAQAPFGTSQTPDAARGEPSGPSQIERKLAGGSIGWLQRHEPRGHSPEELGLTRLPIPPSARVGPVFSRVLAPDPSSSMRMLLALVDPPPGSAGEQNICVDVVSAGAIAGGCSPARSFFPGRPFSVSFSSALGGDQYVTVSGAASDDVARMELYLATGERIVVPLRDNVYLLQAARTSFPARLVAYDEQGRVVGLQTFAHDPLSDAGPRPLPGKQRVRKVVTGRHGAKAVLRVGPSSAGGSCWRISYTGGADASGCLPKGYRGGPKLEAFAREAGGGLFLEGQVRANVASVGVRLHNGRGLTVRPIEGILLAALPATGGPIVVRALGARGEIRAIRRLRLP